MVGKSKIKLINSLSQKKQRTKTGLFVVEGIKGIKELLASNFELEMLFSEESIFTVPDEKMQLLTAEELKKISKLATPQTAVALFRIPKTGAIGAEGFSVALDGVRDPGNLGTIIRLCDWFGIADLICSNDTVDCFNPKVVQASMGSIARVNIVYTDLENHLKQTANPIYGTFMNGENVYESDLSSAGILVLGNEANGISTAISNLTDQKLAIPQFGEQKPTESLNVATATAILLSEFKRRGGRQ